MVLAVAVAGPAAPTFADGVALGELAAVQEADLVLTAIAAELGLRDQSGTSPLEVPQPTLRGRALLVLDNLA